MNRRFRTIEACDVDTIHAISRRLFQASIPYGIEFVIPEVSIADSEEKPLEGQILSDKGEPLIAMFRITTASDEALACVNMIKKDFGISEAEEAN